MPYYNTAPLFEPNTQASVFINPSEVFCSYFYISIHQIFQSNIFCMKICWQLTPTVTGHQGKLAGPKPAKGQLKCWSKTKSIRQIISTCKMRCEFMSYVWVNPQIFVWFLQVTRISGNSNSKLAIIKSHMALCLLSERWLSKCHYPKWQDPDH